MKAFLATWEQMPDVPMSGHGYVAMILGIVFTLLVCCGSMGLLFYSSRHGYDEAPDFNNWALGSHGERSKGIRGEIREGKQMLHGTSADGTGLADAAVILSVMRGLIAKGVIDHTDARLWLHNAIEMIQEDKNASRKKAEAITIIKNEFVPLIGWADRQGGTIIAVVNPLAKGRVDLGDNGSMTPKPKGKPC